MSGSLANWWVRWLNENARPSLKTFLVTLFTLALVGTICAVCATYFPFKSDMDAKSDDQTKSKMMDIQWSIVSLIVTSLVVAIAMITFHATSKPGNCKKYGQEKYCITPTDVSDIIQRVPDKRAVFETKPTGFGKVIKKL